MTGNPPIAEGLAHRLRALFDAGLDADLRAHTAATTLKAIGAAINASHAPPVEIVVSVAREHGGAASAPVPGRAELLDPLNAALATGLAAHLAIVDPNLNQADESVLAAAGKPGAAAYVAAVLGAAVATAPATSPTGAVFLDALALGVEAQLRVAAALTPTHADAGWHVTGTVGPLGAAVTAGLLGGLTAAKLGQALSIASSLTLGHGEGLRTMVEPLHAGKAAANGVLAARLAARGFTGSPTAIEGPRGYFRALTERAAPERILDGLGDRWQLRADGPGTDAERDRRVVEVVERAWPGHAAALIDAVRSLQSAPSCDELLRALTKEPS